MAATYQELEDISSRELGDAAIAALAAYLLDASFVGQGFSEHAQHGFPLVAIQGVSDEDHALPSQELKQAAAMEGVGVEAAMWGAAMGEPSPAEVAIVRAPIALAAEAFVQEGAGGGAIILVIRVFFLHLHPCPSPRPDIASAAAMAGLGLAFLDENGRAVLVAWPLLRTNNTQVKSWRWWDMISSSILIISLIIIIIILIIIIIVAIMPGTAAAAAAGVVTREGGAFEEEYEESLRR